MTLTIRRLVSLTVAIVVAMALLVLVARVTVRYYWDPALAAIAGRPVAPDFGAFLAAGDDVLHGRNPYAPPFPAGDEYSYVYPPLLAVLVSPLALAPDHALTPWSLLLLACTAGTLLALDVRDWRCYVVAAVCPFTRASLEYGAIGPVLALLVALSWRYRDELVRVSATTALAISLKLFLWPIAVWLAVSGRLRTAASALALAFLLLLGSWAVVGFAGLVDYPGLLNDVQSQASASYSLTALGAAMGAPVGVAKLASFAVGGLLLGAAGVVARDQTRSRRERDRRALLLTLAASLALTPVVWNHYLVLLLIPVALTSTRFSAIWLALLATVLLDAFSWYRASPDGELVPLLVVTALTATVFGWCFTSAPDNPDDARRGEEPEPSGLPPQPLAIRS